ncbi:hypothetical protein AAFF_G00435470 [Aldrovandia affinis]|uniref:Uncharacterized protein n=1 Tax=Aldrovandia affinis TaxID=143900 RepID=A0AAD7WIB0_9TELE|nr:hypothetical protein AAFF_G00435470 [Aldrovandia affinis]
MGVQIKLTTGLTSPSAQSFAIISKGSPCAAGKLGAREHDKLPTTPQPGAKPRQRMIFCSEEVKPVFISSSVTRDWGGISFSLYPKSVARGEPR